VTAPEFPQAATRLHPVPRARPGRTRGPVARLRPPTPCPDPRAARVRRCRFPAQPPCRRRAEPSERPRASISWPGGWLGPAASFLHPLFSDGWSGLRGDLRADSGIDDGVCKSNREEDHHTTGRDGNPRVHSRSRR
jgi:hypothetical protein